MIITEKKQQDFLNENTERIVREYLQNDKKKKIGYVQVFVTDDFKLQSIKFIEGKFNKKQFVSLPSNESSKIVGKVENYINIYFEILWSHNFKKNKVMKTVLIQCKSIHNIEVKSM